MDTERRARGAVAACFFVNAVLYANLVPRLPGVKDDLAIGNAAFGVAIAAMPAGALLAGLFAPATIQRFGSARTASYGLTALAVMVASVSLATGWFVFALTMLLIGALDSVIDVAQNAHGFRVQRLYGRSIVNSFHGMWSIGAVSGGLMGAAAAGLDVDLTTHLTVSAILFGVVALTARRFLLPGPEDAERALDGTSISPATDMALIAGSPSDRRPRTIGGIGRASVLTLAALGVLAACGAVVEDAGASWGALYLRNEIGTGAAVGGLAFVALQSAMTLGRLTGDRVVDRFGQRTVARGGGVLVAVGMGAALAVPTVGTTIAGFALAGLGVATLIPAAMHTADELPGLRSGVGLTVVSWLLRVGFLASPPLVGLVADATSLRVALVGVVLAGVGTVVFGRALADQPRATPPPAHR